MSARDIKAEARRRLSGQTLLTLILGAVLMLTVGIAWALCIDGFYAMLDYGIFTALWPTLMDVIRAVAVILGEWLLLFPLICGMRNVAWNALDGAPTDTGMLFVAFTSWRGLFAAWGLIWPFRRGFWRRLSFRLTFVGWLALGILSGGVLLVLYVIPYFTLADTLHLRLTRPQPQSEKEINHV